MALAALLVAEGSPARPDDVWPDNVDPWIVDTVQRYGTAEFLIYLEKQAELAPAGSTRDLRQTTYRQLSAEAARTQGPLLSLLRRLGVEHRPFWIANMIWARGGEADIRTIAGHPAVEHLLANPPVELAAPQSDRSYRAATSGHIEWGLRRTLVPSEFWRHGFDGRGVVIGGQDTGYDWRHPALRTSYRGWDGTRGDHDYNWHDAIHSGGGRCGADSQEPCDDGTHGTHTMGTMIGDDGDGNRIGMAPGARWIGCRNMDQGVGTPATYAECFQWFLAPTDADGRNPDPGRAPDVINNSWTCPPSEGCTNPAALRRIVRNVRAAGILVVASAGNGGPACSTVESPIAIYDAALSVGATDEVDEIASFSSRGPVAVDGSRRVKPDLAAPGVGVRSSVAGGGYELFSGTSMAGPHVAGMAALALSAAECLRGRPDEIERLLLSAARPRAAAASCGPEDAAGIPNSSYGHGVLRAVLPSCPLDGRVSGAATRMAVDKVVCRNERTGRRALIRRDGSPAWNCMAAGLEAGAGDRLRVTVRGRALPSGDLGLSLAGLDAERLTCLNRSTGNRVTQKKIASAASCEDSGLTVAAEDRIKLRIIGRAQAGTDASVYRVR